MEEAFIDRNPVSPDTIKQWKVKYPSGVFELSIDKMKGFVRLPTDKEMMKFCTASKNRDRREHARKFLNTIWLGGDKEIVNNNRLFDQTEHELVKLIKVKENQINSRYNFF